MEPPGLLRIGALAVAGGLGLLPGAAGAGDPVALLAWLVLWAPAAGCLAGAAGIRLWPFGLAVPSIWFFLVVWADTTSERDLASPVWAAMVVAGLFAGGLGWGGFAGSARAWGVWTLLALFLCGLCVQGGLTRGDESWGSLSPGAAALWLDLSPIVFVLDCGGWDVIHSHQMIYRISGVEWFPREPWRGILAGPVVLVVGCVLGIVLPRRSRERHERALS